ncbi:uncharacterized protein LOC116306502 [Actinia tenebrosa]|uniref:Uncharacterized protein LOC116306502 n=1 Tax=Actinia tenebrosa TaxID=6105 RepID=A0A6P8IY82_ACTTE|nr:uncharacterized protein LOC116306502 [Actinia tenebrosa]
MPANRGDPGFLRETVSKIVYRTEYSSSFRGADDPFQNIPIPSHFSRRAAWAAAPHNQNKPTTSRVVQLPLNRVKHETINLQGLQPNRISSHRKIRSATERHTIPFNVTQNSLDRGRPFSGITTSSRARTEELVRTSQSLVARRLQSQLSRFPKDFRYIDKQCFFHPAQELSHKTFFVISPDWVSERQNFIRKNNMFG